MSAPVVPQAKTPKSKAGLLTRPFRSLPGGRLAKSAKVPEQLSGASGADFRKTQKPVVTRLLDSQQRVLSPIRTAFPWPLRGQR